MMRRRRACLRVVRASWNEEKRLTFRGNVLDKFDSHHLSYYHVAGVKKRGFARADKRYARIYCVCVCVRVCACVRVFVHYGCILFVCLGEDVKDVWTFR